ncbi:MAG: DNA alkylation repair protein [Bacteroidota bacterium]
MSLILSQIEVKLVQASSVKRAEHHTRFFKTGKGEYGEGDQFLGITLPFLRKITDRYYKNLFLQEIKTLIESPIHEKRLLAIMVLVKRYSAKNLKYQESIFQFYMEHIDQVNNWDLVDASAPHIIGHYLLHMGDHDLLHRLSQSPSLWRRRISIIATFYFIKNDQLDMTLAIAQQLLHDKEDLIHKAVGCMLREVGKKDHRRLLHFLDQHSHYMPRTMLRYAIDKFNPQERQFYMEAKKRMANSSRKKG